MKIVSINNLKPGMVISEDVFSYHGQCLAKQNTPVTLQLIEHLKFYQIASVSIFPENHGDRNSSTMTAQRLETYSQRIRRSPEFQRFKTDYTKKVSFKLKQVTVCGFNAVFGWCRRNRDGNSVVRFLFAGWNPSESHFEPVMVARSRSVISSPPESCAGYGFSWLTYAVGFG